MMPTDGRKSFEQGPIRPPSEAGSLLIRVTRNCPWNRCVFCGTYKGKEFSRRSLEEIKGDIDTAKDIAGQIAELSWKMGEGGKLTRRVLSSVMQDASLDDCFRSTALWLASGADTVFLQDANSLMLSTDTLIQVMRHIKSSFPQVTRITSYSRAVELKGKSVEDLNRLKEEGLTRIHVGMESGSDKVLKNIKKGTTAAQITEGGRRAVQAGLSLCLYLMPGVGGCELSREHALESAKVVNAINPDFVRFRSLFVRKRSALLDMVANGEFTVPQEDDMVREIRLFIENLDGVRTRLVSDHILNLLEEVEGQLPQDKETMLKVIDRYLSLPEDERLLFQLGRRAGAIRSLDELHHPVTGARLREAKTQIEREIEGGLPAYIQEMKRRFV